VNPPDEAEVTGLAEGVVVSGTEGVLTDVGAPVAPPSNFCEAIAAI
jgi:hypothetical protein